MCIWFFFVGGKETEVDEGKVSAAGESRRECVWDDVLKVKQLLNID